MALRIRMSTTPQRYSLIFYEDIGNYIDERRKVDYVMFSDYEALKLLNQRNEDGLRQIQDIAEQFVGNPGCEMNAVDLVRKMAAIIQTL